MIKKSIELGGRTLTLQKGLLAEQATSAVLAQYGETVVLATVVAAPLKVDLGYFPLSVEYMEKLYAGGKIKGSRWVKREGKPTDEEILTGRLIDRSIRPLFPADYKKEVQVALTVLSVDHENDPDTLAAIATSAALTASSIPWKGPVSILRIGKVGDSFVVNPKVSEFGVSEMDLIVSSTEESVVMLEAGAKEVSEEDVIEGIEFAKEEGKKLIKFINEFAAEFKLEKEKVGESEVTEDLKNKVKKLVSKDLENIVSTWAVHEGPGVLESTKAALKAELKEEDPVLIDKAFEKLLKETTRAMILKGVRPDGRKFDQVRDLGIEVGVLPRTHGSAIFSRGQTQVLSIATLGASSLEQVIETAEGEESKRYMHHYAMPPFATGEVGRMGSPNRREVGHGALAERALEAVIPAEEVFPYAIRVVSEVMSSNGSTSMASTCGSTLALMDAGVPVASPVSGIAMGVIIDSPEKYKVMTDIIGVEDFMGDMDFKVTGTEKGITAIQLDVKTLSLTPKILKEALKQSKDARLSILQQMLKVIEKPRAGVSTHAPKIKVVKIPVEKIGELIGPGGKMIRALIAETGAQIEVNDEGLVSISATDEESVQKAIAKVEGMMKEVQAGEIYDGEVKRVENFGAFVEILPNREGMVHVSDMSMDYVADAHSVVNIGDKLQVRVKEIDNLGRINLSMLLDPAADAEKKEKRGGGERNGGGNRGFSGGGRNFSGGRGGYGGGRGRSNYRGGGGRGGDRGRRFDRGQQDRSDGGPHFPTTRLMGDDKSF